MKVFVFGGAMVVLCTCFLMFQNQYNRAEREVVHAKFAAEEAATAAAQYVMAVPYGMGQTEFNKLAGEKAAAYLIPKMLGLGANLQPLPHSYWHGPVSYQMHFFDNSNTLFPYTFTFGKTSINMAGPTVVVTLSIGKPKFTGFAAPDLSIIAAHAWKPHKPK